jgi:hypothetical protein
MDKVTVTVTLTLSIHKEVYIANGATLLTAKQSCHAAAAAVAVAVGSAEGMHA